MSLAKYQARRTFERTPEPKGKERRSHAQLQFVVQKHDASRLHYDFRLEMDGVLKSWAVPKGPSLNPSDRRLAVQVEDHPLDYAGFEGTIPAGNYGAGTVMVWDKGTYEPVQPGENRADNEKQLLAELESGHIRFVLHGGKLHGQFSLVKIKGDKRGKDNNWLLLKHQDEFADEADVLSNNRSASTNRSLEEIARGSPSANGHAKKQAAPRSRRPKGPLLGHSVKPMLATLVTEPFDRKDWFFEVKWDGYRAIAEIAKGDVKLYSRNFHSYAEKFSAIAQSLIDFGQDAVLDGEIVVLDERGKSHFHLLQSYQKTGEGTLVYYVFDLLYLDGRDLRRLPLRRRKEMLAPLLIDRGNIRLSDHVEEQGLAVYQAATEHELEGVMAKNAASAYHEGLRGRDWLKIKSRKQQEAVIGGFTQPRGTRQKLGALVLGVFEGGELVYIGHAGGGFDDKGLVDMYARLEPFIQKKSPFKVAPRTNAPVQWVKPTLVCEVAFQEWTPDGSMRQPIFLGLREDKSARSVHREWPQPLPKELSKGDHVKPAKSAGLPPGAFTNLEKVYWPAQGYTKGDSLKHYHDLAPLILPYLRDRPLSLLRHPNGIAGPSFFQKDVSGQPPPDWAQTARIHSTSAGKDISYIVCQDEATLLYVANLGCIEINPWNSRVGAIDKPDYLIIDLDPQDVPFSQVVNTAQEVRAVIEKTGGECYCKTSGKRGLHIFVPVGARYDYNRVRSYAEAIARVVHAELPETTSLARQPAQRRHKVYLDFLQNSRGQTIVAPYSLRPVDGAHVSTPLRWQEVNKRLDPARFNMRNIRRRIDRLGDLWQPVLKKGVDLDKCLAGCLALANAR